MRTITLSLLLTVAPSLAVAQSSGAEPAMWQGFSAEGRVQAEATLQAARDQALPEQPLLAVIAEGRAKAAAETQILRAEQHAFARLAAAQDAMVAAGRVDPSDAEVTQGASIMAQGVTATQLGALVARTPADVSLTAAFEAFTSLTAQGLSVTSALAQVEANGGAALDRAAGGAGVAATTETSVGVTGAGSAGTFSGASSATTAASAGVLSR